MKSAPINLEVESTFDLEVLEAEWPRKTPHWDLGHEFQIDSLVVPRWINKRADLVGVEFAALPKAIDAQYRTDRLVHWHDADLKDSVS